MSSASLMLERAVMIGAGSTNCHRRALQGCVKRIPESLLSLDLVEMFSRSRISSTNIRRILFESDIDIALSVLEEQVPIPVLQYLKAWSRLLWHASLSPTSPGAGGLLFWTVVAMHASECAGALPAWS